MAIGDKYPFLAFSVSQTATLAANTVLVTLAAAPTGVPSTTVRIYNNSTVVPVGTVYAMMGTASVATVSNAMAIPPLAPASIFSLGGQTVIQLVMGACTGTVNITAGQGNA